jgi:hypothetical protein
MPIQVEHLLSNLLHQLRTRLQSEQFVVKGVPASDNFDIIDVVAINSWQAHSTVIHLSGEDFIAVEPVSENATI